MKKTLLLIVSSMLVVCSAFADLPALDTYSQVTAEHWDQELADQARHVGIVCSAVDATEIPARYVWQAFGDGSTRGWFSVEERAKGICEIRSNSKECRSIGCKFTYTFDRQ